MEKGNMETSKPGARVIELKMKGKKKVLRGKHFIWSDFNPFRIDKRKPHGRMIEGLRLALIGDVGGNPTPRQMLLIKRACAVYLKLLFCDLEFAKTKGNMGSMPHYIALENSLRRIVQALTPDHKKKKTIDIRDLLLQRQREKSEDPEKKS
jgi:hypothetical protein